MSEAELHDMLHELGDEAAKLRAEVESLNLQLNELVDLGYEFSIHPANESHRYRIIAAGQKIVDGRESTKLCRVEMMDYLCEKPKPCPVHDKEIRYKREKP